MAHVDLGKLDGKLAKVYALYMGPVPMGFSRVNWLRIVATKNPDQLDITMPCGNKLTGASILEAPLVSVPCPCGDPTHWLVKWADEREEPDD